MPRAEERWGPCPVDFVACHSSEGGIAFRQRRGWTGDPLRKSKIDHVIAALLVVYCIVMMAWFAALFTDNLKGFISPAFAAVALVILTAYHLLRARRKRLEERLKDFQRTE